MVVVEDDDDDDDDDDIPLLTWHGGTVWGKGQLS